MPTLKYIPNVATLELDVSLCNGCKMCLIVCPQEVFGYENKRALIVNRDACMECGACVLNCEPGALAVQKGVGCAEAVLNSMVRGGEPSCDCDDDTSCCC